MGDIAIKANSFHMGHRSRSEHHYSTMSLEEQFTVACEEAKSWSISPSNEELLGLYALYKQATVGDVNIDEPSADDARASAKYTAWSKCKDLSPEDAKQKYVDLAEQLKAKYE